MLYLVALLIPPVAVLACGKPAQAAINAVLCVAGLATLVLGVGFALVGAAVIHAIFVSHNHYADQRTARLLAAMSGQPTSPANLRCPHCGQENDPSRAMCSSCWKALARTCTRCHRDNALSLRTCEWCGARLP